MQWGQLNLEDSVITSYLMQFFSVVELPTGLALKTKKQEFQLRKPGGELCAKSDVF